jgi:hypothetical protein
MPLQDVKNAFHVFSQILRLSCSGGRFDIFEKADSLREALQISAFGHQSAVLERSTSSFDQFDGQSAA